MTKTVALLPELRGCFGPDADGDWIVDILGPGLAFAVADEEKARAIVAAIEATQTDQQLREALAELEQQATATLGAIDRYNEENGTSLGGAPMFKLGRAIARARSYLSSSLTK